MFGEMTLVSLLFYRKYLLIYLIVKEKSICSIAQGFILVEKIHGNYLSTLFIYKKLEHIYIHFIIT